MNEPSEELVQRMCVAYYRSHICRDNDSLTVYHECKDKILNRLNDGQEAIETVNRIKEKYNI